MKRFSLSILSTVFFFLYIVIGVQAQSIKKADKLISVLSTKDCKEGVKLAKTIYIPNYTNSNGDNLFLCAVSSGCTEVVKILLANGANVNIKSTDGTTALSIATEMGNTELIKLLLENKVNVNFQSSDGLTVLMIASIKGNTELAKLLLENGANVNIKSSDGITGLMIASLKGNSELVKLLLEKEANFNAQASDGFTSLMYASDIGKSEVVKLLLEKGANVNVQSSNGITALMLASEKGHNEIVKLFLNNGANTELKTIKSGETALIKASVKGNTEVVKLLLENGAVNSDTILVSELEMNEIKQKLSSLANPFTLRDLYNCATSEEVIKGGSKYESKPNSNSQVYHTFYVAKNEMVDVFSMNSSFTLIEFLELRDEKNKDFIESDIGKSKNSERLFTLYYPSVNVSSGLFFKRILVWDTNKVTKNIYTFKDGNWYKQGK